MELIYPVVDRDHRYEHASQYNGAYDHATASKRQQSPSKHYSHLSLPAANNRRDRDTWNTVHRDNVTLARKLKDIARQPPSTFHAPRGTESLRRRDAADSGHTPMHVSAPSAMTGTFTYVEPKHYQPGSLHGRTQKETQQQRASSNMLLAKKLQERYQVRADSLAAQHNIGRQMDCRDRCA